MWSHDYNMVIESMVDSTIVRNRIVFVNMIVDKTTDPDTGKNPFDSWIGELVNVIDSKYKTNVILSSSCGLNIYKTESKGW